MGCIISTRKTTSGDGRKSKQQHDKTAPSAHRQRVLSRLQRVIFPAQVANFAPKLTIFEITPQSPLSYAILNPRTPPKNVERENRKDERNEEKDFVGLVGSDVGGRDGAATAVAGRSSRGYLWDLR